MEIGFIATDKAPGAIGPYSQAVQAGNMLFTSGQIPLSSEGNVISGSIEEQTHQVFRNLQAVLAEAGFTFHHVVKATVFITNMDEFSKVNEIYADYFGDHRPSRSTVQVARLPRDVGIEIELIAVK